MEIPDKNSDPCRSAIHITGGVLCEIVISGDTASISLLLRPQMIPEGIEIKNAIRRLNIPLKIVTAIFS